MTPALVRRPRRGNVLVEFAAVALILVLILTATLDLGRATYSAQAVQTAADRIARDLAQTPLPAEWTARQALDTYTTDSNADGQAVYSRDWLVIDVTDWPAGVTLTQYLDTLPIPPGNRLLVPLMYLERNPQNPLVPDGALPRGAGGELRGRHRVHGPHPAGQDRGRGRSGRPGGRMAGRRGTGVEQ